MVESRAATLVASIGHLIPIPQVCARLQEMLQSERSSAVEISKVIGQDPALSARLLRLANSPLYGSAQRVDTISRAVTLIGTAELQSIVVAILARRSFDRLFIPANMLQKFWRHSIYAGVIGRTLAKHCGVLHRERLFVACLLHDVGHLVMWHRIPGLMQVMEHRARVAQLPPFIAEREVFDLDHCDVGAALIEHWNLPSSLLDVVQLHHSPEKWSTNALDCAIVHISDRLAHVVDSDVSLADVRIAPVALELTQANLAMLPKLIADASLLFNESMALLAPSEKRA